MALRLYNRRLDNVLNSSKSKTFTTIGLTALIILLIIAFCLVPVISSINQQRAVRKDKEVYLENLKTKKAALDTLLTEFNNNKETIDQFNDIALSRNGNEILVANFDVLAKKHNVVLTFNEFKNTVVPKDSPVSGDGSLVAQMFTSTFTGKFENLKQIIVELESFPIPIQIRKVEIMLKKEFKDNTNVIMGSNPDLTMTVEGLYYFWNQKPNE